MSLSPDKHTILVVDDTPENLALLGELLQLKYRVRIANSGQRALQVAQSDPQPDLILLDVMMPEMDGYATLSQLQIHESTRDIPVIFVTALDDSGDEERGLALGAVDYITKPINPAVLQARIHTHLMLKEAQEWLRKKNERLEIEVTRRTQENTLTQEFSLKAIAHLSEKRDPETGQHLAHCAAYVQILASQLSIHPRFRNELSPQHIHLLVKSVPLHDIGKVGIPDAILLKPGALTVEERALIQKHSKIGSEALALAEQESGQMIDFLNTAKTIALYHHEKWDGSGYPEGLAGDKIPICARLTALADVLDTLLSKRVYKKAMSFDQAVECIQAERGKHFDPDVVDAFIQRLADFKKTSETDHLADEVELQAIRF